MPDKRIWTRIAQRESKRWEGESIMPGKKSKNKGAGFERQVAALLSETYGADFRRTPLSGGWAAQYADAAGDIVCVEPHKFREEHGFSFVYCVECKKSEGWKFASLFTNNHAWFDSWWEQTVDECPNGKLPILVFSRNRSPIWVAAHYDTLWGCPGPHMTFALGDERIVVSLFEEFLEWDAEAIEV